MTNLKQTIISFEDFFQTLDRQNINIRAKQFEKFVKWYLSNDPVWKLKIKQIWLWDEHPMRPEWGPDCGIDLVFEDQEGNNWAVQAKCFSPDTSIKKDDMNSFIAESSDKRFQKRLLIASTDLIGPNVDRVLKRHNVVRLLLEDFKQSTISFPKSPTNLESLKTIKRLDPLPHQTRAVDEICEKLKRTDRGQVHMACGTGKTNTMLYLHEKLNYKNILMLVPSLSLVSQTLRAWSNNAEIPFKWLCVCSDKTISNKDEDNDLIIKEISEMSVSVTSDLEEIQKFINSQGKKIIISTYQSSKLIANSQKNFDNNFFDIVFADEAHRCAGKVSSYFSTILQEGKIKAKKRLFFTATPKIYSNAIKGKSKSDGIEIASMDDKELFGDVLFKLSFSQAIKESLLSDYQVVVIGVDDPMIYKQILNRDLITTNGENCIDAERLASKIGLHKAIKNYSLNRIITFHSRVKNAKEFSEDFNEVIDLDKSTNEDVSKIKCTYVSGEMKTSERNEKIRNLKSIKNNETKIIANAKVLSEGVDVPALDGIAFIDPKRSQIDIIQAIGRSIRKSNNKEVGTIVLPVYLGDVENTKDEILASRFKDIWQIILALKCQDDSLMLTIDNLRIKLGLQKNRRENYKGLEKIIFDLPERVKPSFVDALQTLLIMNTSDDWYERLGQVKRFYGKKNRYPCKNEENGAWVSHQRRTYKLNKLKPEKFELLNNLEGWVWEVIDSKWMSKYSQIMDYTVQNNGNLPKGRKKHDPLTFWMSNQRKRKILGKLSTDKIKLCESIPNWEWEPAESVFISSLNKLKVYMSKNDNKLPPRKIAPGQFAARLIKKYKEGKLSTLRIRLVENSIGCIWI
tara:strand:- start:115 stop:2670 length:2556 start_codon:yes stop_codon:yes gene_type:complete